MPMILDLKQLKDGMTITDSVVYLNGYKKLPKKDNKSFYITGEIVNKADAMAIKVWDAVLVEHLSTHDLVGSVVSISGSVGSYNNVLEIKVDSIAPANPAEYPISAFRKSADVEALFKEFGDFVNANLSEKGIALLMGVFKAENLFDKFKTEYAANKMHDAQIGGLLNHTLKMLRLTKVVLASDPRLSAIPNMADLLYIGVALHDIGKIFEMDMGVYVKNSFVTHRTLAVDMIVKYKQSIIQLYSDTFYFQILSVLQGHHGEFGDPPTTVAAYIVHLIDMVDSQVTGILDKIERNDVTQRGTQDSVYTGKWSLTI